MYNSTKTMSTMTSIREQLAASGTITSSNTEGYSDINRWIRFSKQYETEHNSAGLPKYSLWLILALPANDFSNCIEYHKTFPMLVPKPGAGKLAGIARTKKEADEIMEADRIHVHLVYKVKIQGQEAWRDLIDFLAEHNMLETEPK